MLDTQDLQGAFKLANLTVAALAVLTGFFQLFSGLQPFIHGLFIIAFGLLIGLLEFRIPAEVATYASFMFLFIGRGVFYILIALLVNGGLFLRVVSLMLIFLVGLVYVGLEAVPLITPPENMSTEGVTLETEDIV